MKVDAEPIMKTYHSVNKVVDTSDLSNLIL